MKVAVVGGGIVGLFTARYLEKEGAEVTLFEQGPPGSGSVHAAGIIEPATAYRTNTFAFLRRVWRFWRSGTCTFRTADPTWLVESLRQLERPMMAGAEEVMGRLSATSVAEYRAMARARNDFGLVERGLLERFDDPKHFTEETALALSQRSTVPVEVRAEGRAGSLFFPDVGWLDTDQFVARIVRDLGRSTILRQRVTRVELDGTVVAGSTSSTFDAVAVCAGVSCRRLGVPLTGVRGYGWHARLRERVDQATIFVDRGIAVVPFAERAKVTGGWDFDLSASPFHVSKVLDAVRRTVAVDATSPPQQGSRPCTPDGLPTVGRRDRLVVATGGFRLGWSFAPGLGQHAARLCLDQEENDPFLARFCGSLRSADLR